MAPSTSTALQARINAFEALSQQSTSRSSPNLLDDPLSPSVSVSFSPIVPASRPPASTHAPSPSPSPPNLGRKTSLIDLKDWVLDDDPTLTPSPAPVLPPRSTSKPFQNGTPPIAVSRPSPRHVSDPVAPLINLEPSPPTNSTPSVGTGTRPAGAPPLPPRKPSYSSLKSVSTASLSASTTPSSSVPRSPIGQPLPPPRAARDTLTADHTYPPAGSGTPTLGLGLGLTRPGHAPASSISSFHSVSLSSDGGNDRSPSSPTGLTISPTSHPDRDNTSLHDSFEHLSPASVSSPSATGPPKLPQRPTPASAPAFKSPIPSSKPPPPPPPSRTRAPSRTSSTSTTASSSSSASTAASSLGLSSSLTTVKAPPMRHAPASLTPVQLTRPPPIPPAARARYEALFDRNIRAQQSVTHARNSTRSPPPTARARTAAGWRGVSVDLLTTGGAGAEPGAGGRDEESGRREEARLAGETVRRIWTRSRLSKERLKVIWSECDPAGTGALDREGFVCGMWRIDEELRRAQLVGGRYGMGMGLGRHGSSAGARGLGRMGSGTKMILR